MTFWHRPNKEKGDMGGWRAWRDICILSMQSPHSRDEEVKE